MTFMSSLSQRFWDKLPTQAGSATPTAEERTAPCDAHRITIFAAARNVRFWHKADILGLSSNVRFWGQSGRTLIGGAPMSAFDPKRTSGAQDRCIANRPLNPI